MMIRKIDFAAAVILVATNFWSGSFGGPLGSPAAGAPWPDFFSSPSSLAGGSMMQSPLFPSSSNIGGDYTNSHLGFISNNGFHGSLPSAIKSRSFDSGDPKQPVQNNPVEQFSVGSGRVLVPKSSPSPSYAISDQRKHFQILPSSNQGAPLGTDLNNGGRKIVPQHQQLQPPQFQRQPANSNFGYGAMANNNQFNPQHRFYKIQSTPQPLTVTSGGRIPNYPLNGQQNNQFPGRNYAISNINSGNGGQGPLNGDNNNNKFPEFSPSAGVVNLPEPANNFGSQFGPGNMRDGPSDPGFRGGMNDQGQQMPSHFQRQGGMPQPPFPPNGRPGLYPPQRPYMNERFNRPTGNFGSRVVPNPNAPPGNRGYYPPPNMDGSWQRIQPPNNGQQQFQQPNFYGQPAPNPMFDRDVQHQIRPIQANYGIRPMWRKTDDVVDPRFGQQDDRSQLDRTTKGNEPAIQATTVNVESRFNDCIHLLQHHFTLISPGFSQPTATQATTAATTETLPPVVDTSYRPETEQTGHLKSGHRLIKCHNKKYVTLEEKFPYIFCCGTRAFNVKTAFCINDEVIMRPNDHTIQDALEASKIINSLPAIAQELQHHHHHFDTTTEATTKTASTTVATTQLQETTIPSTQPSTSTTTTVQMTTTTTTKPIPPETTITQMTPAVVTGWIEPEAELGYMGAMAVGIDDLSKMGGIAEFKQQAINPENNLNSTTDNSVPRLNPVARSRNSLSVSESDNRNEQFSDDDISQLQQFTSALCDEEESNVYCCGNFIYRKVPGQICCDGMYAVSDNSQLACCGQEPYDITASMCIEPGQDSQRVESRK